MAGSPKRSTAIATPPSTDPAELDRPQHHAVLAAAAAAEKKATDILALDVGDIIAITDCFVLATAGNARHVRTVVDEVETQLAVLADVRPLRVEGLDDATWVLMDYGHVVVHVFQAETRAYYQLERLWADAPHIDVSDVVGPDVESGRIASRR
jgi:ribosome-associated protein